VLSGEKVRLLFPFGLDLLILVDFLDIFKTVNSLKWLFARRYDVS
jgi:hypothetical protein